ncbi:MAG: hypothetical protein LAQ69_18215 [Acidobacteriia bacterium]|nr:hypothetical protein [Terriglobia bacterium]
MSNQAKLAELRAKTDRELLTLIQPELDRGMALANVAASKGSPLYAQAEKVYETVMMLVLRIAGLRRRDRVRAERKLKELRLALDQVPALAKVLRSMNSFG